MTTFSTDWIGAVDWTPARQADDLDRLLSALLDIQDDLAAVVTWLAEHWSADLPAPGWTGTGGDYEKKRGPALRLPVCCSPTELDRIAALLGVEPVDDQAPDTCGNRYRRVCRSFGTGRVELHAYQQIRYGELVR